LPTKKKDNPYVTKFECQQISGGIREELKTIRVALVGEDMRGGLVKDVANLKKERSTTVEILKSVAVPITVAIITALILSFL
jgi:hypothetical protein